MSSQRRHALIALTAAGLAWGLTIPLSKLALGWLDPLWMGVARFALAAPVLALVARRTLRGAVGADVVAWGIVFYAATIALQNSGVDHTSVTHAALIFGAIPALVAVVAAVRGIGTAGPLAWTGFAAAFAGVALVAGSGGDATPLGDGLMLGSAVLSALFIVAQPRVLRGRDPVAVTAVQMAAGAAVTLPFALLLEPLPAAPAVAGEAWAFAGLLVVGSLLPFALYAYGQTHVPPEVAGSFVNLEPLVGVAVGALALGEPFGTVQLAGAAAILAGMALASLSPARGAPRPAFAANVPEYPL